MNIAQTGVLMNGRNGYCISAPQTGTLPDSARWDTAAAETRAHVAMLAARDLANVAVKHSLGMRDIDEPAVADLFEKTAAQYRGMELAFARAAGLTR